MKKHLHMETTQIEPAKTAQEIIQELVKSGAVSINTDYQDGKISGLRWVIKVNGKDVLFDMPVRTLPIFKILNGRRDLYVRKQNEARDLAQAERVSWRQLLRWVQAQNAMIETGMVEAAEVYMPYMVLNPSNGQTLFQKMTESSFLLLESPK